MMATQTNRDAPNIIGQIQPNTVGAEIGVWMGNSSDKMLQQGIKELHLVDPYSVQPYKDNSEMPFEQYIAKYQTITGEFSEAGFTNYYNQVYALVKKKFELDKRVSLHRMTSREFFVKNKDIELDWVYVDGDHSYEGCLFDLETVLPHIKKGGIIMGDDYGWPKARWQKKGVTKAVNEFKDKYQFPIKRFGETQFLIKI